MTDPVDPIGRPRVVRGPDRRQPGSERRAKPEAAVPKLPVPLEPAARAPQDEPRPKRGGFAAFFAQMMGQGGQKRGLRGGPETLDRARTAYLETEWSGPADRRPRPGRITKTEI